MASPLHKASPAGLLSPCLMLYQVSQKMFKRLEGMGYEMLKGYIQTETSTFRSKANLDEKMFLLASLIIETQKLGWYC